MGTEDPNSGSRTASPSSAADDLVSWGTPGPRNLFLSSEGARSGPLSAPGGGQSGPARGCRGRVGILGLGAGRLWARASRADTQSAERGRRDLAAPPWFSAEQGSLPFKPAAHSPPKGSEGAGIPGTPCAPVTGLGTWLRLGQTEVSLEPSQRGALVFGSQLTKLPGVTCCHFSLPTKGTCGQREA